tara:strand:+ start:41060 stop:50125 length:9066 start_codon:yes stop_codon:yes gene_type:complete
MSVKDLFGDKKTNLSSLSVTSVEKLGRDAESAGHINERLSEKLRFVAHVDFSTASNFAKYGLAEKYYEDSITRIYQQYPYDGALAEKTKFLNDATYLDLWMLENRYPKSNGYAVFSPAAWGTADDTVAGWGAPSSKEYIVSHGGPHTGTLNLASKSLADGFGTPTHRTSPLSNLYETDIYTNENILSDERNGSRESNLKFNLSNGVSTEFWIRKGDWITALTEKEVVFDLWNGTASGSANGASYDPKSGYGRLLIYLTGSGDENGDEDDAFRVHLASGSSVWDLSFGGSTITTSSLTNTWKHCAFTFLSSAADAQLQSKFYVDGELLETKTTTDKPFGEVTGSLIAHIGALQTTPSGNAYFGESMIGSAKLSGSLDEFRYWKTKRTSKDIGRNWFTQVGGGSNNDVSNADLGMYYKFNEGKTGTSSIDSTVLDYSGRVTNGNFVGYAAASRNTGSAILSASAASFEFEDPIIYSFHPRVKTLLTELKSSGSVHDLANNANMYMSYPSFMPEEDEATTGMLKELTQVAASYFDTLHLQIEQLPRIQDPYYASSSYKPLPFSNRLLESHGFIAPEIFANSEILEKISNRDEDRDFISEFEDVKNRIYKNIYNNLIKIYKTKGTDKAFRNLVRCFGVDEELVRINIYGNNATHRIRDNYRFKATKNKCLNFATSSNHGATVFQSSGSDVNTAQTTYISGTAQSTAGKYLANTVEVEVLFPLEADKLSQNYVGPTFLTSSIFGFHNALLDFTDTTQLDAADDYSFELYSVRPDVFSKDAYFVLTDENTSNKFRITSSLFKDVYTNQKWTFAIKSNYGTQFPLSDGVSGSTSISYQSSSIEFHAVNADLDVIKNEFVFQTQSVDGNFVTLPRRYWLGARRTNFTGTLENSSDVKIADFKHWSGYLDREAVRAHARDSENYGTRNPYKSTWLMQTEMDGVWVPQMETLALHWDFENLTGSDSNGLLLVSDVSSGSYVTGTNARYKNTFGGVIENQYAGLGYGFSANDSGSIDVEYIPSARQTLPEIVSSLDMVDILENPQDDVVFTRETRPVNYFFSFEKSMYQTISEEMLNIFSTMVEYNTLMGAPVNRYRFDYKDMGKLRQLFFENVKNTPDLDKFVSYYKWIDNALGMMLMQLVPATADSSEGIRTMVESHILERNKYRSIFPNIKRIVPTFEARIKAIPEMLYPWKFGHNPEYSTNKQNENSYYWKDRAERDGTIITSGDSTVDPQRETVRIENIIHVSSSGPTLANLDRSTYEGSAYTIRKFTKPYQYSMAFEPAIHGGSNYPVNQKPDFFLPLVDQDTDSMVIKNVLDSVSDNDLTKKDNRDDLVHPDLDKVRQKVQVHSKEASGQLESQRGYGTNKGTLTAPFSVYSSSINSGYQRFIRTFADVDITNIHSDAYGNDYEVPMQGPFTEKFVGGNQVRHIDLNTGSTLDTHATRPELWDIAAAASILNLRARRRPGAAMHYAEAKYSRGTKVKRPVNIQNIKMVTGSTTQIVSGTLQAGIGNYQKPYQVIQTSDRRLTNSEFVRQEGFSTSSVTTTYLGAADGLIDYAKPTRTPHKHVIVERFSAPGGPDVAGDTIGGPALDYESGQFSPYNSLNYRNLTVRIPLRTLLTESSDRHGVRAGTTLRGADYLNTASLHKRYRNRAERLEYSGQHTGDTGSVTTASYYDNYYVTSMIPSRDLQYGWLSSSVSSTFIQNFAPVDGRYSGSTGYSSAFNFVSGTGYVSSPHFVDAAGLNRLIVEPLSSSEATIGFPAATSILGYKNTAIAEIPTELLFNGIMMHRDNRAGFSSWKQLRASDNPLSRYWKKRNVITAAEKVGPTRTRDIEGVTTTVKDRRGPLIKKTEPPVASSQKPIQYSLTFGESGESYDLLAAYGNLNNYFSNEQLNEQADFLFPIDGLTVRKPESYRKIKDLYTRGTAKLNCLTVRQQVYPRERHTYLDTARKRNNYSNNFWRNLRATRTTLYPTGTISKISKGTYSRWSMDEDTTFSSNGTGSNAGILQNNHTHMRPVKGRYTAMTGTILYALKHSLGATASLTSVCGLKEQVDKSKSFISTKHILGFVHTGGGNSAWQAGQQAGHINASGQFISKSANPWHDSYDEYAQEPRAHNKDYSIVPEFRISEHISDYILKRKGNFLSENPSHLSIFGVATGSDDLLEAEGVRPKTTHDSSQSTFYKVYSNSDFIKHLGPIKKDHKLIADPSELELTCKVVSKFIPYDGFYPAEQLVELFTQFSKSYSHRVASAGAHASAGDSMKRAPFFTPMFAPGIWCNTIKAGIACDFPVATGALDFHNPYNDIDNTSSDYWLVATSSTPRVDSSNALLGWDRRIPFEATVNPERYLANTTLTHMMPSPFENMNITCSWDGTGDPLYKMKAHNFLASTIDFFHPDGQMASLASVPEKQFGAFESGTTYGMRVKLQRSYNKNRSLSKIITRGFEVPEDHKADADDGVRESITMYSRPSAFGPPVSGRGDIADTGSAGSFNKQIMLDSLQGINPAFTPGYYDGPCWLDILYTHDSNNQPTLDRIQATADVVGWRFDPEHFAGVNNAFSTNNSHPYGADNINLFSMQLSHSVNALGKASIKSVEYDAAGNPISVKDDETEKSNLWVIQPKFTTPILNFSGTSATVPTLCSESVTRGMWHQYGKIPTGSTGIFLTVDDIPPSWLENRASTFGSSSQSSGSTPGHPGRNYQQYNTIYNSGSVESLADKLKFRDRSVKLGQLSEKTTVKEAIVAIPFIEIGNRRQFFAVSKKEISLAIKSADTGDDLGVGSSIVEMVSRMKNYVFPPRFNFLAYPKKVKPFAMYIFEFETDFDQTDLAHIWQNLAPPTGQQVKLSSAKIQHKLLTNEFFGASAKKTGDPLPDKLKWMVFKVKQKAKYDYFDKVAMENVESDSRYKFGFDIAGSTPGQSSEEYSYNWPYDYFTCIEFAKLEASVKFCKDFDEEDQKLRPPTDLLKKEESQTSDTQAPAAGLSRGASQTEKQIQANPAGTDLSTQAAAGPTTNASGAKISKSDARIASTANVGTNTIDMDY